MHPDQPSTPSVRQVRRSTQNHLDIRKRPVTQTYLPNPKRIELSAATQPQPVNFFQGVSTGFSISNMSWKWNGWAAEAMCRHCCAPSRQTRFAFVKCRSIFLEMKTSTNLSITEKPNEYLMWAIIQYRRSVCQIWSNLSNFSHLVKNQRPFLPYSSIILTNCCHFTLLFQKEHR